MNARAITHRLQKGLGSTTGGAPAQIAPSARSISSSTRKGHDSRDKDLEATISDSDSMPKEASQTKTAAAKKISSIADADAQLRERLEKMSGGGGAAGIEYEDGKPSAMKRGVRNNMFRLI